MSNTTSEFKAVFSDTTLSDDFYRFLQVIFHLYPEDKFHYLIADTSKTLATDEAIYKAVQTGLPKIKPFLSELTLALPALKKQKREMARQVVQLLGSRTAIDGYVEIGATGRYISELRKHVSCSGNIYLVNDIAPNNSVADIFERGQLGKIGTFLPLTYQPLGQQELPTESIDLVTCHIGLHHCPPELLEGFIRSIHRVLKKDGLFVLRDHDVTNNSMATFVSLVHTVFNLGLNVPWETEAAEFKSFKPIAAWSRIVAALGFEDTGQRILQDKDPSANTLISFKKLSL